MQQEALDRGTTTMRKNYEASAAKGRMTAEQVAAAMVARTPTLTFDALADCDLIIEAVYEEMGVKKDIFGKLDAIAKPGAILASNTSYLDINEIAASTKRPQDVLGMHRSEEHTSELQSLMRISYAVFCLKKKNR